MSSHDGIIELNREITRLESALAAEREKVAALADRVRGLEGALEAIASQDARYEGKEPPDENGIIRNIEAYARAALTPPGPAEGVTSGD